MVHSDSIKELNLLNLSKEKKTRLRGKTIVAYLHGNKMVDTKALFNLTEKGVARISIWTLHKFITRSVINHWNIPQGEEVDFPSLSVLGTFAWYYLFEGMDVYL